MSGWAHVMKRCLSEFRLYLCNDWVAHIPSHRLRLFFYRRIMGFTFAPTSTIFMRTSFDCARHFSLGENSVINQGCRLDNRGTISIGKSVSISQDCCLLTADHDPRDPAFATRSNSIVIEDYVWLGTGALILPGVRLGAGCVVGAGSVVTKSVEPFAIMAGNPAQKIGERPQNLSYSTYYRRLFQ